jgi:putative Mg2+ transporter-C (MgtC) family protein
MTIDWNLILRLFVGGLLGGLIGLEREIRAKGAGTRTHFIVALGSALYMIVSQYAFFGSFDTSRVASGVVSGIGFIGAGVIIFQKNVIRGITTAAGLWVAAAVGMACGGGMFFIAGAATLLTLLCLEMLHFFHIRYGEKVVELDLSSTDSRGLLSVLDILKAQGMNVDSYSISDGKLHLSLRLKLRNHLDELRKLVKALDGFKIETMN